MGWYFRGKNIFNNSNLKKYQFKIESAEDIFKDVSF